MKRTRREWIAGAAAVAVLLAGIFISLNPPSIGTVLKRLKPSQVEYVGVYWPRYTHTHELEARLSESEAEEVISLLSQVELSGETEQDVFNWQGLEIIRMFHVKLKNGTEFDFAAATPFWAIDTENCGYSQLSRENTMTFYYYRGEYRFENFHIDQEDYDLGEAIRMRYFNLKEKYFAQYEPVRYWEW